MAMNMECTLERTSELDVLNIAADALRERDRLEQAMRDSNDRIRQLCRDWGDAAGLWGVAPHHLAQACRARGLL